VLKPLGLPAQKGWEISSPLSGSHPPRLSEKFVAVSVFIDAFIIEVYQPLCTNVAHTGCPTRFAASGFRLGSERTREYAHRFAPTIGSLKGNSPRPFFVIAFVVMELVTFYHAKVILSRLFAKVHIYFTKSCRCATQSETASAPTAFPTATIRMNRIPSQVK